VSTVVKKEQVTNQQLHVPQAQVTTGHTTGHTTHSFSNPAMREETYVNKVFQQNDSPPQVCLSSYS